MKFVDETTITVSAGNGGDGSLSFRREKFLPKGGPDGGNGGRGGDVILVVEPDLNTLADFRYTRIFRAKNGSQGSGKNCTGRAGTNCEVRVPIGTLVFDADSNELITDMVDVCQRPVVAYGGKGGAGNTQFKSSTNRAPRKTTPGKLGEKRRLRLELQVLADVGLLGLPNAGKSTLLRAMSSARPKVGDYPFTTLYPQLGIVERELHRFVIADIPGLIKGAAMGVGLGISFLKHLRRTRLLLHVVDIGTEKYSDPINAVRTVEHELKAFDEQLATRSRWIVFNKADLISQNEVDQVATTLLGALSWADPFYVISATTGEGCASLTADIFSWINDAGQGASGV
jgi:GTP-binding protein